MTDKQERRGRRGRSARREARTQNVPSSTAPYIKRQIPLTELLSEEGLATIEANADSLLQEIGIEFREDDEAIELWKESGADIDGERVRFPKGLLQSLIATAPRSFTQHARNPERNVRIGGPNTVFVPAYGPPFVRNLDDGRRYATIEDFENFVKLPETYPLIGAGFAKAAGDDLLANYKAGFSFGPFSIDALAADPTDGTYTFWWKEGANQTSYTLNFVVQSQ